MAGEETQRQQMNVVVVGHVDHGKSTVIGRLLADTRSLPEGKLDAVRRECRRTGKVFEYAFLLDALSDEQDQGITIDTARVFFKTARRDYIIIDAPGHIEFLKNMVSGAARAEAAVLVIDAREGVRENSRRHGYLLSMLGISQIVVLVNKMDLVGNDEARFQEIVREYGAFLAEAGAPRPECFIPVSALHGENLAARAAGMPWYQGPTLLELLDRFCKAPPREDRALRMPVQAIYKFTGEGDDRRIVAGRIEAGQVGVGDEVLFSPSGKRARVRTIEGFNSSPRTSVGTGWSTGFTLDQEIYVTRGDVMSRPDQAPRIARAIRANVIWLAREPFVTGRSYKLKLGTAAGPVSIRQIARVIDAGDLDSRATPDRVERHAVAEVVLELRQPIACDPISECEATGRFVIVDGYDVAGGGIITGVEELGVEAEQARRPVSAAERAARLGHRASVLVLGGGSSQLQAETGVLLERALFERDYVAAVVEDGPSPDAAFERTAVLARAGVIAIVPAVDVAAGTVLGRRAHESLGVEVIVLDGAGDGGALVDQVIASLDAQRLLSKGAGI